MPMLRALAMVVLACLFASGCDESAVERGVGAACSKNEDCTESGQVCLTEFKGGMCGIANCTSSSACPSGSVCVADPDFSKNYCLLTCVDKPDCNQNRPVESEASCSSTLNQVDPPDGGTSPKVCRPPNG